MIIMIMVCAFLCSFAQLQFSSTSHRKATLSASFLQREKCDEYQNTYYNNKKSGKT